MTTTPTQPTPQPAGDAAVVQAFHELAKTIRKKADHVADYGISGMKGKETLDSWAFLIESLIPAETDRAIQAGKGAQIRLPERLDGVAEWPDDPKMQAFVQGYNQAIAEAEQAVMLAALAGSQGEVVVNPECSEKFHFWGPMHVVRKCYICKKQEDLTTTPAPAAPDGDGLREIIDGMRADVKLRSDMPTSGCSAAMNKWADRLEALSGQRVGEAVADHWRVGDRNGGYSYFGTRAEAECHGHDPVACFTAPPTAIPDGMVVDDVKQAFLSAMKDKHGYTPGLWPNGEPINGRDFDRLDGFNLAFSILCDNAGYKSKYEDLIYQVGSKYEGETRHETAKRYLRQAEQQDNNQASAAAPGSAEGVGP